MFIQAAGFFCLLVFYSVSSCFSSFNSVQHGWMQRQSEEHVKFLAQRRMRWQSLRTVAALSITKFLTAKLLVVICFLNNWHGEVLSDQNIQINNNPWLAQATMSGILLPGYSLLTKPKDFTESSERGKYQTGMIYKSFLGFISSGSSAWSWQG